MKPVVKVGQDAIQEMVAALNLISDAIGSTLGPGGRPFSYDRVDISGRLSATFTKDGLTVLRSLGFENPAAEAVLAFCKQAASHSVIASGDGTTSTIVLASEIAKQVLNSKHKYPQAFARLLERTAALAIERIKAEAITNSDIIKKVALTSTNGDEELTEIVLKAVEKSSAFGAIIAEKNPATKERYQILTQDGYGQCHGYDYNNTLAWSASEKAASNEPIEWTNPYVAIFNGNILTERQLDPILSAWNLTFGDTISRKLIIVAYEISDEIANKLLVINRTLSSKGGGVFVVKPRLSAEINSGLQSLRDIAAFCGVSDEHIIDGGNYKNVCDAFFGDCAKIKITPTNTVFMGRSEKHWVDQRIHQNLKIAEEARSQADRELTTKRNALLTDGLVKIVIGGGLLPDLQERADRLDDASKAVCSCMKNGALPGCGCSFIRAAVLIENEKNSAVVALKEAFKTIHEIIMKNYGTEPMFNIGETKGATVFLDESGSVSFGDAINLGVLDATDTVCAVIKNGVDLGVKIAILGGYSLRSDQGMVVDEM